MFKDIKKILYHESTILSRLDELASEITEDYRRKDITIIAILNGSFIFMADLLRRIPLHLQVDCLSVSSYHGTQSTGQVNLRKSQLADANGRHLLILDDILDTGATLKRIREHLDHETSALSLKICVLLRKTIDRPRLAEADYVGFDIPDEFVVGYGLDYNQQYRNLPFVGVLTDQAIRRYHVSPIAQARELSSQSAERERGKRRQAPR